MQGGPYGAIVWVIVLVVVAVLVYRKRRQGRLGAGAAGTVYDMLNEDRRNALEIIVEERAGARDPEHRDGDLPQLENPKSNKR